MMSLRYDAITPALDEAAVAELLTDLNEASSLLAAAEQVPSAVLAFVQALPARLHAESPAAALWGDPYLAEHAFAGAARAAAGLLDEDPARARRSARVALEQVRQALRDVLEARPVDEDVPPGAVAGWLERVLGLPQQQVASLVGTSARTWQRWLSGAAEPDPYLLSRLRRIARLTHHLQHSLTGPGVGRWFSRPHPLIKDGAGTPLDLLDDPEGYRLLLSLAAGMRSTQAS